MLVALNVATPFAAIWGPAPLNVPPPALVPKPSMIPGLAAVSRLLNWSRTSTWIAGVMAAPATTLLGPTRKERLVAAAGLTVTVSRWVIGTPATMADTTFASANVELKLPVAMPLALDVDVAGFAEPAPLMTAQLIVTPATGLLNWSATRTESGVVSGWPTVPVWRSPPFTDIWVAPATLAVIVNVTVGRPVTPAVVVWVPGVGPRVRVLVAWPFTSVSEDVGLTEPPPEAGAQVTVTFPTGLPLASVTSTLCGVASVLPT